MGLQRYRLVLPRDDQGNWPASQIVTLCDMHGSHLTANPAPYEWVEVDDIGIGLPSPKCQRCVLVEHVDLPALPYPRKWTPPAFTFGQRVYYRSDNTMRYVAGMAYGYSRYNEYGYWLYMLAERSDCSDIYSTNNLESESSLAGDPQPNVDADYQNYLSQCESVHRTPASWETWHNAWVTLERLDPRTTYELVPGEPQMIADLKQVLCVGVEIPD
jgi:hypothetical protein